MIDNFNNNNYNNINNMIINIKRDKSNNKIILKWFITKKYELLWYYLIFII